MTDCTLRLITGGRGALPCDRGIADAACQKLILGRAMIESMTDCALRNRLLWRATLPYRSRRSGILPWRSRRSGTLPWRSRGSWTLPWRSRGSGTLPWRSRGSGTHPWRKSALMLCKMAFIPYIM